MSKLAESEIHDILESILQDTACCQGLTCSQPDKAVVVGLLEKLQCVVFPRHYAHVLNLDATSRYQLGGLLEEIYETLSEQTAIALMKVEKYAGMNELQRHAAAEELVRQFLKTLPRIRAYLKMDVEAAYDGDPAAYNNDEVVLSYPGLYAIMVNRLAHELFLLNIPMIPRIMTEHAHSLTGIDIHPGATIGKYFFIDHGTGVVIGETTTIGDHVKIYQGVTLGALSTRGGQVLKSKKRHPTIENGVTIYSGASILGGDTVIGEDVIVGGNSFITKSIPAGSRVSIRNPELQIRGSSERENKVVLDQDECW